MLVNMKGVLADAAKGGYAVGGFNFASLESGMGAVRASEELGVPFVCKVAHEFGATVEAELGEMPHNLKGELREYTPEDYYTKPEAS